MENHGIDVRAAAERGCARRCSPCRRSGRTRWRPSTANSSASSRPGSGPSRSSNRGRRILIGGGAGPKLFAHIAEYADGWMPIGGAGLAAELADVCARHAEARGRDPGALHIVPMGVFPTDEKLDYYREVGVTEAVLRLPSAPRETRCCRCSTTTFSIWRDSRERGPARAEAGVARIGFDAIQAFRYAAARISSTPRLADASRGRRHEGSARTAAPARFGGPRRMKRGPPVHRGRGEVSKRAARLARGRGARSYGTPPPITRLGRAPRLRHGLAAEALRRGLCGHQLAQGIRRPRRHADRAADLLRGDRPGERALRRRQLRRRPARRPDDHGRGHARAEGQAHPAHHLGRRGLVSGLLRAGRRLATWRACRRRPCATATITS